MLIMHSNPVFTYYDKDGKTLFWVTRYDKSEKHFLPSYKDENGKVINKRPPLKPRPIYNLLEVLEKKELTVVVVEGEEVCDFFKGKTKEYVFCTWAFGSAVKNAQETDWSVLSGRKIVLSPDNDDPGRKVMREIAKILIKEKVEKIMMIPSKGTQTAEDLKDLAPKEKIDEWIDWHASGLIYAPCDLDFHGKTKPTQSNAVNLLTQFKVRPYYNILADKIEVYGTRNGMSELTDMFLSDLKLMIMERYKVDFKEKILKSALNAMAGRNPYNPVQDYFESLPRWDGVERMATAFTRYLGVPNSVSANGVSYIQEVSKLFLMSIVARTFQPGKAFDYLLILAGPQGSGKTNFGRFLMPFEKLADDDGYQRV